MKNKVLASLAAIPFALGTVFAGAATALEGAFQLNAGQLFDPLNGFSTPGSTSATFSSNGLTFAPGFSSNPDDISTISIVSGTGDFAGFNMAQIGDIQFNPPIYTDPFLDFGSGLPFTTNQSIQDNQNVFRLNSTDFTVKQSAENLVAIDVALYGEFDIGGEVTAGQGLLTLQYAADGATIDMVEELINTEEGLTGLALSGALFTASTPEPTVLFGLGVAATGLVATRRKKASK